VKWNRWKLAAVALCLLFWGVLALLVEAAR